MKNGEVESLITRRKPKTLSGSDLLSSGVTLLNLGCSGTVTGCFAKSHYYLMVGDSASGKTFLALTTLAEATINPAFDDYRLIYDASENGMLMDVGHFFGSKLEERIEAPATRKNGNPRYSETVEEFYYRLDDAFGKGEPFIYVLDSMDGVVPKAFLEKHKKNKAAFEKGKQEAGDFGVQKAKLNSQHLPGVISRLRETGSMLIIISQSRDNISGGPWGDKKTRGGGRALRFYATLELWTSIKQSIKKKVNDKNRKQGIVMQVQVKKNRISGWEPAVDIPIYNSSGIDDVGGCIEFLISEGHWKKSQGKVDAVELEIRGSKESLIRQIQEGSLEDELGMVVSKVWKGIEEQLRVDRKRKYD